MLMDERLGLAIVCDGVGGSQSGEVASETCALAIRDYWSQHQAIVEQYNRAPSAALREKLQVTMQAAIQFANQKVLEKASQNSSMRGMCTTVDVLILTKDHAVIGHVGDSRIYLVREQRTYQMTQDHRVSDEMIRQGLWTKSQAESSGMTNVLTRAIGNQDFVQADTLLVELMPQDVFFLCTDGLAGYLEGDELNQTLGTNSLEKAPTALIDYAKSKGGKDNVTAIALKLEDAPHVPQAIDAIRKGELLGTVPLFRFLTYPELTQVLSLVEVVEFKSGTDMIVEGTPGSELYILISGEAQVYKGRQLLTSKGKGAIFGDMSLFENAPRSATVRTAADIQAMKLTRQQLLALFRKDSQIAVKFLWALNQELSARLRSTSHDLAEARNR
jgi:serine/threonine protein phosphatase PrpC